MKCKQVKSSLISYLFGECPRETTPLIEKHLVKCPKCQQEMDSLVEIKEMCGQWSEQPLSSKFLQNMLLKTKPDILTPEELALYLRIPIDEIMASLENIPHIEIGKYIRFKRKSIMEWIETIEHKPLKTIEELELAWHTSENRIKNMLM